MCRSRRELSNEYLVAKIGVDTAENEPLEVWGKIQVIIRLPPSLPPRERTAQILLFEKIEWSAEVDKVLFR